MTMQNDEGRLSKRAVADHLAMSVYRVAGKNTGERWPMLLMAAGAAAMALSGPAWAVTYSAANTFDISPAALLGSGNISYGYAAFGSQQVGYGGGGNTGNATHALLWTGTA